jgi:hypothetical protein
MDWAHVALVGTLYIGVAVVLTLSGLFAVRRAVPHHVLAPHNDVAGFIYATIAVTYAVILGFVVVTVWEQYEEARDNVDHEASDIADLYRLAAWFPETEQGSIRQALIDYTDSVIDDEWDAMNQRAAPSPQTTAAIDHLWQLYRQVGEGPTEQSTAYDDSLDRLQELGDARRARLIESREGIPGIMWLGLIAGAVLTVTFAYGFGVERGQSHAIMLATLAASVALLLFMISSLNHAFRGGFRVDPEPFQLVLRQFSVA